MAKSPEWQRWEEQVNADLGLDGTITSGNQWHDPGDGVDRSDSDFALIHDAKFTQNLSYSIRSKDWRQWTQKARSLGKTFVQPLRLNNMEWGNTDVVIVSYEDFKELVRSYREKELTVSHLELDEEDHKFFKHLCENLQPMPFRLKVIQLYAKLRGEKNPNR